MVILVTSRFNIDDWEGRRFIANRNNRYLAVSQSLQFLNKWIYSNFVGKDVGRFIANRIAWSRWEKFLGIIIFNTMWYNNTTRFIYLQMPVLNVAEEWERKMADSIDLKHTTWNDLTIHSLSWKFHIKLLITALHKFLGEKIIL